MYMYVYLYLTCMYMYTYMYVYLMHMWTFENRPHPSGMLNAPVLGKGMTCAYCIVYCACAWFWSYVLQWEMKGGVAIIWWAWALSYQQNQQLNWMSSEQELSPCLDPKCVYNTCRYYVRRGGLMGLSTWLQLLQSVLNHCTSLSLSKLNALQKLTCKL